MEGPAFSLTFQLLTTLIVGGCAAWMLKIWSQGGAGELRRDLVVWGLAGMAMMGWTWWSIMRSRTRLDTQGLYQRWIWDKHMVYDDLAYAKLIRVPGLDWLIAPRLYVRTLMGKFNVFYGATPALIKDFERLVVELRNFRNF